MSLLKTHTHQGREGRLASEHDFASETAPANLRPRAGVIGKDRGNRWDGSIEDLIHDRENATVHAGVNKTPVECFHSPGITKPRAICGPARLLLLPWVTR
jgi:hypothetical protein